MVESGDATIRPSVARESMKFIWETDHFCVDSKGLKGNKDLFKDPAVFRKKNNSKFLD